MAAPIPTGTRLAGKVAIVTGGGSGFGATISHVFAAQGAKVLLCDLNGPAASKVASAYPNNIIALQMNVTSADDWKNAVNRATSEWGGIGVLVNNAGTSYKNKPSLEVTEEEYTRCFDVNVKSVFLSVGAVLPSMIKKGSGVMINISSTGATRPRKGLAWYNATKGAVSTATKALAMEYGPQNIRVNSISPLLSGTGLFESFAGVPDTPKNREQFLADVPLGRLTETTDVANAALFLASDEAKFITGANLFVDGGKTI